MNKHPYLRAYLAGIAVPTMFMLIVLTFFIVARFVYNVPVAIERLLVFPMAVVPNLWGVWNMLYVRLDSRHRLPFGIHGAVLVLLLAPIGLTLAKALDLWIVTPTLVITVLPVGLIVYYLAWKHIVGFFNQLLRVG
ncbi:MAG: hypothetical protein AABN95_08615 [Acidobacteriota bacterium]